MNEKNNDFEFNRIMSFCKIQKNRKRGIKMAYFDNSANCNPDAWPPLPPGADIELEEENKKSEKEELYIVFEKIAGSIVSKWTKFQLSYNQLVDYINTANALKKQYYLFKAKDRIVPEVKVEVNLNQ